MAQPNPQRFTEGQPASATPESISAAGAEPNPSIAQILPVPLANASKGVPIQCQFCVGQRFRRSRLRVGDIKHLLLMRYPVRCLFCSQRQLVSFTVAGVSLPSHVRQPKKRTRSSRE